MKLTVIRVWQVGSGAWLAVAGSQRLQTAPEALSTSCRLLRETLVETQRTARLATD